MKKWNEWMDKYNSHIRRSEYYAFYGYNLATAATKIIKMPATV